MVDETESGACGTVGYLRDGRRSVEEQCPVEDTYQLQYDVETQTEDSVQQADGTYVVFDSEIIPLIDVVLQTRLVDADGHVVGEAVSEAQLMPVAPAEMEQEIELKNPNLWSIDAPYMYEVERHLKNKEDRRGTRPLLYSYRHPYFPLRCTKKDLS